MDKAGHIGWPWSPELRPRPPGITGCLKSAVELGVADEERQLVRLAALTAIAVPEALPVTIDFRIQDRRLGVSIDMPDCELRKWMWRSEAGRMVKFDFYKVSRRHRETGRAARLFRNLMVAYSELDVRRVETYANLERGAYVWARLAGVPEDPEIQREKLRHIVQRGVNRGDVSRRVALVLQGLIESAPANRVMYDFARAGGSGGSPPARTLLRGHGWDAYWDLTDPDHRTLLMEALSNDR